MPEEYVPTAEEIAGHYSAALDSVNLVNELAAKAELTEDEEGTIRRNVEHLELMVAKEFWTNQNMKPLTDAIAAGKSAVA
jgi:hypothetical protein